MINKQFVNLYKRLNPKQKEAVDTIEGPVMVVAGPGTGKTQILTLRIANILLKTQVNPENILALTFTESAAMEMRQRLSEIIGTHAFRVEIGTFHGFSNSIIKSYPEEFERLLSAESITEVEQIEILESLIESLDLNLLRPFGEPLHYLRDSLSAINDLKKEGVEPDDLKAAIDKEKEDFFKIDDLYHDKGRYGGEMKGKYQDLQKQIQKQEELVSIFEGYQYELRKEKKYDFNDMLLSVVSLLESNKGLLLLLQERYQYVLVDEHQDTNATQNKLVELLMSFYENPNLFVVGDEKQAIYRFQGASLENFLYFQKLYPSAKLINLEENYRSHQGILDAANSVILNNISANILTSGESLKAQKDEQSSLADEQSSLPDKEFSKIRLAKMEDYYSEYQFIAEEILEKVSRGQDPSEMAVLARRNADLVEMSKSLERVGVEFVMEADQDIFSDNCVLKLILILRAISNFGEETTLIKAMHIDFLEIAPLDIYKILEYSRKDLPAGRQGKKSFLNTANKLTKKVIKDLELENPEKITEFLGKLKKWVTVSNNETLDDLFVQILNESGLKECILKNNNRYQTLQKISVLYEEIKGKVFKNPEYSLEDFLNFLETLKRHNLVLKSGSSLVSQKGVRLLTVHKSKGLEFDFVYLINCFDGHWGSARKRGAKINLPWSYLGADKKTEIDFSEIEDERRLFFVALTRARKGVLISYSKNSAELREQIVSQFVYEIRPELLDEVSTLVFEEKFKGQREIIFSPRNLKRINPKDKEYFNKLFLEKGLSATSFGNFLECPWKYFYMNLIGLPEIKNRYLIFGSAMHYALESFIKKRKVKKLDVDFLIKKFDEVLGNYGLKEREIKELRAKGDRALRGYFENIIPSWGENIQSELVIRGVKFGDNSFLNGRLDMLEPLGGNSFRVHDFKTGKAKSRSQIDGSNPKSPYNYLRQLVFYKILLDKFKDGLMKTDEGVIDFVEPDSKGRFKSETFLITEKQTKELEVQIKSAADQILNLSFWDTECGEKDCEYCLLRKITFESVD